MNILKKIGEQSYEEDESGDGRLEYFRNLVNNNKLEEPAQVIQFYDQEFDKNEIDNLNESITKSKKRNEFSSISKRDK